MNSSNDIIVRSLFIKLLWFEYLPPKIVNQPVFQKLEIDFFFTLFKFYMKHKKVVK